MHPTHTTVVVLAAAPSPPLLRTLDACAAQYTSLHTLHFHRFTRHASATPHDAHMASCADDGVVGDAGKAWPGSADRPHLGSDQSRDGAGAGVGSVSAAAAAGAAAEAGSSAVEAGMRPDHHDGGDDVAVGGSGDSGLSGGGGNGGWGEWGDGAAACILAAARRPFSFGITFIMSSAGCARRRWHTHKSLVIFFT